MESSLLGMSPVSAADQEAPAPLRWRAWPLVDQPRWSWLAAAGMLAIGAIVLRISNSWIAAVVATAGFAATIWQVFVPVHYEIGPLGLRSNALGRERLVPWSVIRSYQLRPTGIVLYERIDPTQADALRSTFLPFSSDPDEILCALRLFAPSAVEYGG